MPPLFFNRYGLNRALAMGCIVVLAVLWLPAVNLSATSADWLWARRAGDVGDPERGVAVVADRVGNCFVTGYFISPTVTFTGRTNAVTLTNTFRSRGLEIFLAKYSPAGELLWAQSAGGPDNDYSSAIAADAAGNVIITGTYTSEYAVFGTDTNVAELAGWLGDGQMLFVAKYAPDGRLLWAQQGQGYIASVGVAVQVDAAGHVVVAGGFGNDYFERGGAFTIGTAGASVTLTNAGWWDSFLARFSADGQVLGAAVVAGGGNASAGDLALDSTGHIYLSGGFSGQRVVVGAGSNTITLTKTALETGTFLAKLDTNWNALWVRPHGGRLAVDPNGGLYVASSFSTNITLGTGESSAMLTNVGLADICLAKYETDGRLLWARSAGGTGDDSPIDLGVDGNGNVFVAGDFGGWEFGIKRTHATFGEGDTAVTLWSVGDAGGNLSGLSSSDAFVASYNGDGILNWVKQAGGTNLDSAWGVAADGSGGCYVTGFFAATALFGNGGGSILLTNASPELSTQDGFLARLGALPRFAGIARSPAGDVNFTITGSPGVEVQLEASDTLNTWTPISTLTLTARTNSAGDATANGLPRRFYRLIQP